MSQEPEIIEVAARDGLQNEKKVLSPSTRAAFIQNLVVVGFRRIEAVSFARPDLVPAMAGAEEVMSLVPRSAGVSYSGLVLNRRGMQRAVDSGVDEVNLVIPATDVFAERNQNSSVNGLLAELEQIGEIAQREGIPLTVSVAVAFGCPFQGDVPEDQALEVARRALECAPVDELAFADTIGCAQPWQVGSLFQAASGISEVPLRAHFHETRHTALANVYAAMSVGVGRFDSSVAGLGGCPFAPGAAGNVATEDLAWMLGRAGLGTGVDIAAAIKAGREICAELGVEPRSGIAAAGVFPNR